MQAVLVVKLLKDVTLYEDYFDGLKLATRVSKFPLKIINAYCGGSYSGNLPEILEPNHAGVFYPQVIENKKIPDSLFYFEGGKDYNIGADIEALGKRNEESLLRICDKRFSDAEKQAVYTAADKEEQFLRLWTKKEAYLKLIGIGIKGIADADTVALEKDYIFYTEKVSLEGKEYVFSVCVKR